MNSDLSCAGVATALNVALNFILIPLYGILGAAVATLTSEMVWIGTAVTLFNRRVATVSLAAHLRNPLVGGFAMSAFLYLGRDMALALRAFGGIVLYLMVFFGLSSAMKRFRG